MWLLDKIMKKEEKLSVEEAKQKLYDELSDYTGWKFLKGQQCLRKNINDMVFDIQFYSSKYNSSNKSVEINCEFAFWNKKFDNICNVNSKIGFISFSPKNDYWYDISTESKINKVIEELKNKIDNYAISLTNKFEENYDKAINFLCEDDMQELYNLKPLKNFKKLINLK